MQMKTLTSDNKGQDDSAPLSADNGDKGHGADVRDKMKYMLRLMLGTEVIVTLMQ